MFDSFYDAGNRALYHRVPIQFLEYFRSEMSNENKFLRLDTVVLELACPRHDIVHRRPDNLPV